MYTLIIECVYVDSEHKSWPKRTEARVTNKERTHHVTFLKLYRCDLNDFGFVEKMQGATKYILIHTSGAL